MEKGEPFVCETSNTLETLGFEAEGLRPTRDKVDEESDYLEILRKIKKISVFAYFCLEAALNDNIVSFTEHYFGKPRSGTAAENAPLSASGNLRNLLKSVHARTVRETRSSSNSQEKELFAPASVSPFFPFPALIRRRL